MVQALFYLRLKKQLLRTRPDVIARLDRAFTAAVSLAGGSFDKRHGTSLQVPSLLSASFSEDRIGFLLDMLIFLGKIKEKFEEEGRELLGHALVLGREIPEEENERLCRKFSGGAVTRFSGIWCCRELREALEPYGVFEAPEAGADGGYSELKTLENPNAQANPFPYREKITQMLLQGREGNVLLAGPPFMGKRDGVYQFCKSIMGEDTPPLAIRFENGSPACFADALSPGIRTFLDSAGKSKSLRELDSLADFLSKERLRSELYPALIENARRFLKQLLSVYVEAVRKKGGTGRAVVVLENISRAASHAVVLFREVYGNLDKRGSFLVIGTCSLPALADGSPDDENTVDFPVEEYRNWGAVFPRVVKFSSRDFPVRDKIEMPRCLLEISYTFVLLGRFFPPRLFSSIFEEEGLNPEMPAKALEMLKILGLIDTEDDPRPRIPDFTSWAEQFLSGAAKSGFALSGKDNIKSMVKDRLLAWVDSGKINPCFALLRMLENLGDKAKDALVLRIIREDIHNGAYRELEAFSESGGFQKLAGPSGSVLLWTFRTLKALIWEGEKGIKETFELPVPDEPGRNLFPGFKAQILVNQGSCKLGFGDTDESEKAVKEAMLINQTLKDRALSAYRLFSLVNLTRNRLSEAMEYILFAVEQTGKTRGEPRFSEPALSSGRHTSGAGIHGNRKNDESAEQLKALYFAAAIHFLYGNLSKAEEFTLKVEEISGEAGTAGARSENTRNSFLGLPSDWAAKARFLRGRILFEAGEYRDALELFSSLSRDVLGGGVSEGPSLFTPEPIDRDKTLAAWIYRTKIYARPGVPPEKPVLPNSDGQVFIAEAAFMTGDYKEALFLTEEFLKEQDGGPEEDDAGKKAFFFTEQPDWTSGFSQCENIIIPQGESLKRLARIYKTLSQCCLGVKGEEQGRLTDQWQDFFRHDLLPDGDPGDTFYYYSYYTILQKTGASRVDMGTTVSMAFKRLQLRAGRIDDGKVRQSYVSKNYWNGALSLAAKEYRLI